MHDVHYRNTGRIVGLLYIIGTVVGVLSVPLLNPRTAPDFFAEISANQGTFTVGALLVLVMGFSLAFIPAFMFPISRKHSEPAGIAYIVFRGGLLYPLYGWIYLSLYIANNNLQN